MAGTAWPIQDLPTGKSVFRELTRVRGGKERKWNEKEEVKTKQHKMYLHRQYYYKI
jgi:hypothetical protein